MSNLIYETMDRYLSNNGSRREFVRTLTTLGLSSLAADSLLAFAGQDKAVPGREAEQLPTQSFTMAEGLAGALLVEQLQAVGVKYIFHTNTSGLETILDALVDKPEMQVIMVTHEGQAVSTAQGYALGSGQLGCFLGSRVGVGNTISNLYNAWKDRTPLIVGFARFGLRQQGGRDVVEEWDAHLEPKCSGLTRCSQERS